jgi:hypothetical protein
MRQPGRFDMLESEILLDAMALLASPQLWAWIAIAAAAAYLLWLLSPILALFLIVVPLFYKETRMLTERYGRS